MKSQPVFAGLARSVWQVGVENRTSTPTVGTGSPARRRWLPQLSPLGGQLPAPCQVSERCPALPSTPNSSRYSIMKSSNLSPSSYVTLGKHLAS